MRGPDDHTNDESSLLKRSWCATEESVGTYVARYGINPGLIFARVQVNQQLEAQAWATASLRSLGTASFFCLERRGGGRHKEHFRRRRRCTLAATPRNAYRVATNPKNLPHRLKASNLCRLRATPWTRFLPGNIPERPSDPVFGPHIILRIRESMT